MSRSLNVVKHLLPRTHCSDTSFDQLRLLVVHTPRSRSCSVLSITASPLAHCSLCVNSIGWCFLVICIDLHLEMLSWSPALEEDFGSLSGHYLIELRLLQSLFL